jgi:hypothetical protein
MAMTTAKRWLTLILLALLILPPVVFSAWAWGTLHYVYASGERAGYVQKISKKGWLCKTWEGELAMVNLPGTMPEIFNFTVRDDQVAHDLERLIGQRVSLTYEQHKGIPTTCFGETEYFVVRIAPVADAAPAAPNPAPATTPSST